MQTEVKEKENYEKQQVTLRWLREKKEAKERKEKEIKELRDKLALSYRYFRRNNSDQAPRTDRIISVGWKVVLDIDTDTTMVQYAVALCGKSESFSRKDAQRIIDERFDKGFVNSFEINLNEFPEKTINALVRIHYNTGKNDANTLGMKRTPNWAKYIP
jgi:hypothetical protein